MEVELLLQVLEARVDVAKLLLLLTSMHRDVPFERESTCELPRAVAAREAAPATSDLLGQWLLSYCNRFGLGQQMRRCVNRRHVVADAVVSCLCLWTFNE